MDKYFKIGSLTMDPANPETGWRASYFERYPCGHRSPETAIDVVVVHTGENVPLNCVFEPLVHFACVDFLEVLGTDVQRYLALGNVYDVLGNKIPELRTIGANHKIEVRGGPKSSRFGFCKTCHRFLYIPKGKQYILRADLRDQPLYYASYGPLIVNEEICARVQKHRWKKLYIREIPVFEKPLDGLPFDLAEIKPEDLLNELVSFVGWEGRSLEETRQLTTRLVRKYGEQAVDEGTNELYEVDTNRDPSIVQLTAKGREIAKHIIGPQFE